jgi:hypothetical protein
VFCCPRHRRYDHLARSGRFCCYRVRQAPARRSHPQLTRFGDHDDAAAVY